MHKKIELEVGSKNSTVFLYFLSPIVMYTGNLCDHKDIITDMIVPPANLTVSLHTIPAHPLS